MEDEDIVGPGSKESTLARGGGDDGCHKLSDLWKRAPLNELADLLNFFSFFSPPNLLWWGGEKSKRENDRPHVVLKAEMRLSLT